MHQHRQNNLRRLLRSLVHADIWGHAEKTRCLAQYNGCKWMGGVLRVEPASMHYTVKLAAEEAADLLEEQEWKLSVEQPEAERPDQFDAKDLPPLNIPRRDGKKVAPASLSAHFLQCILARNLHQNLCYVWTGIHAPPIDAKQLHNSMGPNVMMLACLLFI
jgi:hypothetical protein